MTRRTQLISLLSLSGTLVLGSLVYGQGPRGPAGPGAMGGPPAPAAPGAPAADTGTVTNTETMTSTETIGTDVGGDGTDAGLPKTGGEPLLMTLLGSLTAGSALLLRRKLR